MSECGTKDIERLLRSVPAKMLGTEYEPAYLMCHVAADELARLRAESMKLAQLWDEREANLRAEVADAKDDALRLHREKMDQLDANIALRAENERLRAALEDIAKDRTTNTRDVESANIEYGMETMADIAREALAQAPK